MLAGLFSYFMLIWGSQEVWKSHCCPSKWELSCNRKMSSVRKQKRPKCVLSKLHVVEEPLKLNLCVCNEALLTGISCNHIKLCMYHTHINSFLASCNFEAGCLLLDLGLIRFYVKEMWRSASWWRKQATCCRLWRQERKAVWGEEAVQGVCVVLCPVGRNWQQIPISRLH